MRHSGYAIGVHSTKQSVGDAGQRPGPYPLHRPDVALAAHANETGEEMNWLPDMDLNHDKQIQSLLCYRYTIGQTGALERLKSLMSQSSRQTSARLQEQRDADACPGHAVPKGQATIAQRFNAGLEANRSGVPKGRSRTESGRCVPTVPSGLLCQAGFFPALKRRAILKMSLRDKGTRHGFVNRNS